MPIDWAGDGFAHQQQGQPVWVAGGATLGYCAFCSVAADGKSRVVQPGSYELVIGNGAATELSFALAATGSAVPVPV